MVDPKSKVSPAIPITVNQCNGTGNVGGSGVTCKASIITKVTNMTDPRAATATRTATATPTPTPTPTASTQAASGQVQTGAGSTAGSDHAGLLMLGAALVLAGSVGALLFRRYAPPGFFRRFTRRG